MPQKIKPDQISKNDQSGLVWPTLIEGKLIKRYKRFIADIRLITGEIVTAHCPNSGSMKECSQPGRPAYISRSDNPNRKLKYTWELIDMPSSLVGVNTLIPNRLTAHAIVTGQVEALSGYDQLAREVKVGDRSRLDIFLSAEERRPCYVEVKNCTLVSNGKARFPDAVTARGLKHLIELKRLVQKGCRTVMFYLIQRMDATSFSPADRIDPEYGQGLRAAVAAGVEILAYDVAIDLPASISKTTVVEAATIRLNRKVKIIM